MFRFTLVLIFNVAIHSSGLSQEFVFIESSLSNIGYHYFNQTYLIQLSLKENRVYPRIEFADGYDFEAEFKLLSSKLQQTIPTEYWNAKSRPALTDTIQRISSEYFLKWTFGKIEKEKNVSYYGQLIVHFSDASTAATVTGVKLKGTNEFTVPDSKKVIDLYQKFKVNQQKNPPPPLPPIPRN